jgi:hypothetical protein
METTMKPTPSTTPSTKPPAARGEPPLGETLGGGVFSVAEELHGGGPQGLYLGRRLGEEPRCLVSVIWAPRGVPVEQLRRQLAYHATGVPELLYLGPFDARGDDEARRAFQRQHVALVEEMPAGEWLPRLLPAGRPLGVPAALALGVSLGRLLHRAAHQGALLVGVRPEYVWARREAGRLRAVAATGRNWDFFAHTGGASRSARPLFERHYYAPEVYEERGAREESLVFTLAILIAEWASGAFPFPDSFAGGAMSSQCAGRHAPLEVPAALARVLEECLRPAPGQRPSLPVLLERLGSLAEGRA